MAKTLVLFDFDGTLTKYDTYIKFIIFTQGYLKAVLGFAIFSPLIMLYKINCWSGHRLKKAMTNYFFNLYAEDSLNKKGEEFIEKTLMKEGINESVYQKFKEHKVNGHEICIVSASLDVWIRPFCKKHDVHYLCTELKFNHGIYEGEFKTLNCNGAEKSNRINEKYNLKDYAEIIAYGNSNGDREMFNLAGQVIKV